jgi:hypothetical protein
MVPLPDDLKVAIAILIVPPAFYVFQVARRSGELWRFKVRRFALACLVYGGTLFFMPSLGYSIYESALFGWFCGLSMAFIMVPKPSRKRYIPKALRREVIARFEQKGGKFDPQRHELDHIVPFSKGGDHSLTNLRVIEKSINRSRGSKMPKLRDFR